MYLHLLADLTIVYNSIATLCAFYQSLSGWQAEDVDADFVYFGCGLRLLQLIPDREETAGALDT